MSFPKEFIWGVASSAYQIEGGAREGGRGESVWDVFCHTPGKIVGGDDADIACDSYHRWREDLQMIQDMGLHAYRFSLSWTRCDPKGDGNWNEEGFTYYNTLIDAMLQMDIKPMVTLYHWDTPQALEEQGGWRNEETAHRFAAYAAECARRFHGRAACYVTLNEPQCTTFLGHGSGEHAPGLTLSEEEQFAVCRNLIYAHCLATKEIRAIDPDVNVNIASTGRVCYPATDSEQDIAAARAMMFSTEDGQWGFTHQMVFEPLCLGHWPAALGQKLEKYFAAVPAHQLAAYADGRPDELWLNIYNGNEVRMGKDGPEYVTRYRGFPSTALKWPVTPQSLEWGPRFLHERYGLPVMISEDGLACNDKIYLDGKVHDADRIDFLTRYLCALERAIDSGVPVHGYLHWSLTDNFEWHSGYTERFGLVYMDYLTLQRIPKDSAAWFARVAASNGAFLHEKP